MGWKLTCLGYLPLVAANSYQLQVGGAGWALHFDGEGDHLRLAEVPPCPPFTIELWSKTLETDSRRALLHRYSTDTRETQFILQTGEVRLHSSWTGFSYTSGPRGEFNHVAMVVDGRSWRVYVNGLEVRTWETSQEDVDRMCMGSAVEFPFVLGAQLGRLPDGKLGIYEPWSPWDFNNKGKAAFAGEIDELRWWNKNLSREEVRKWMMVAPGEDQPNLFRRWSFDTPLRRDEGLAGPGLGRENNYLPDPIVSGVSLAAGPVVVDVQSAAEMTARICATVAPAVPAAVATVCFPNYTLIEPVNVTIQDQPTIISTPTGSTPLECAFTKELEPQLTGVTWAAETASLFCSIIRFRKRVNARGRHSLPFAVSVPLPAWTGTTQPLQDRGTLEVHLDRTWRKAWDGTDGTHPLRPVAGWSKAVQFDGLSSFLSLGMIEPPSLEKGAAFTLSFWVQPFLVSTKAKLLSQHTADSQLFSLGFGRGGYEIWLNCSTSCNGGMWRTEAQLTFPAAADDTVLPSGKTAWEVIHERGLPHLATVIIRCHSRGNTDPINDPARATVRMFVNGGSLGDVEVDACWHSSADSVSNVAAWVLGAEFRPRSGQRGLWPTAFFEGVVDNVQFWERELQAEEIQSLAQGSEVSSEALLASFDFDFMEGSACRLQQLVDPTRVCFERFYSEEAVETAALTDRYYYTGQAHSLHLPASGFPTIQLPSPFHQIRASVRRTVLLEGTCAVEDLSTSSERLCESQWQCSQWSVSLNENFTLPPNLTLEQGLLRYCPEPGIRGELQVPVSACGFFVCDASWAIFNVLRAGPNISRVQVLPQFNSLRLLFSEPTNTPAADDRPSLSQLLTFASLPPNTTMLPGAWEDGGQALRIPFSKAESVGTAPDWMRELLLYPDGELAENMSDLTVMVNLAGNLRDGALESFPSSAEASLSEVLVCGEGNVIPPGSPGCEGCPAGRMAVPAEATCLPCSVGRFQSLSMQTSCNLCPVGRYANSTGSSSCTSCDSSLPGSSTPLEGSRTASLCTCPPDTAWSVPSQGARPRCKACGEGLLCLGGLQEKDEGQIETLTRHQPPLQAAGFSAGPPEWEGGEPSFLVRCSSRLRCPSGLPLGSCPPYTSGRACALCVSGAYRTGGSCAACQETDTVLSAVVPVLILAALAVIIFRIGTRPPAVFCSFSATLSSSCSVVFAAVQVIGALTDLEVPWPEPMPTLKAWIGALLLNIDQQRLQCFLGFDSPLFSYLGSLAAYPIIATLLTLGLLFKRFVLRRKVSRSNAINMHGLGLMSVFTSIAVVSILPLKCRSDNPDGSSIVESYRSVVCWKTDVHLGMVAASIVACLIFVMGFVSTLIWTTMAYSSHIARPGGAEHLVRFRFLFGPFTPERFYFGLLFCIRKLMIALVPMLAVNVPQAQLLFVMLVISSNLTLQCTLWPWRTSHSNILDAVTAMLLIVLIVAGFMTSDFDRQGNDEIAMWLVSISLSVCLGAFLSLLARFLWRRLRKRRTYSIFLSHHKVGAGLLARWMKMLLTELGEVGIFLDSDDLLQLDKLINIVAYDTQTVVVLLTRETLSRPWCAMELAAAYKVGTRVIPVPCDGFEGITDDFLDSLPSIWTAEQQTTMSSGGVTLAEVRKAYSQLRCEEPIPLSRAGADPHTHMALAKKIVARCRRNYMGPAAEGAEQTLSLRAVSTLMTGRTNSNSTRPSTVGSATSTAGSSSSIAASSTAASSTPTSKSKRCRVAILSDLKADEAACACRVVQKLLQENLQESVNIESTWPDMWPPCILVALRAGLFRELSFAEMLTLAYEDANVQELVPLLTGDFCDFPTTEFWTDLRQGLIFSFEDMARKGLDADRVEAAYRRLFNRLAVRFSGHGSHDIQHAQIVSMANQIRACLERTVKSENTGRSRTESLNSANRTRTSSSARSRSESADSASRIRTLSPGKTRSESEDTLRARTLSDGDWQAEGSCRKLPSLLPAGAVKTVAI